MFEPLDPLKKEIRFFRLLPGPDSSRISGTVQTNHEPWMRGVSMSGPDICDQQSDTVLSRPLEPYYEALSYEWGDPNGTKHTICVNGRPIQIRDNLFQALHCLRSKSFFGPIWIDALCIDQNNVRERNHQVGMMSLIYSFASKVRVWLGAQDPQVIRAFPLVSRIAARCLLEAEKALGPMMEGEYDRKLEHFQYLAASEYLGEEGRFGGRRWDKSVTQEWASNIISWLASPNFQEWDVLIAFLERSYWTRIWIVQEYFLAEDITICFGVETMDGQDLQIAINSIRMLRLNNLRKAWRHSGSAIKRLHGTVGTKMVEMRMIREGSSLIELLESTKESKCQDPHDRIYAITSLAEDISSFYDTIPIDYNRSIFRVKMDIAWAVQTRSRFSKNYVSRLCSLLDEIFADCPDDD